MVKLIELETSRAKSQPEHAALYKIVLNPICLWLLFQALPKGAGCQQAAVQAPARSRCIRLALLR